MPKVTEQARYRDPLMTKKAIAAALRVSVRTVDRWIAAGLPTRNVFGAVRCNPQDVSDWLCTTMAIDLPRAWSTEMDEAHSRQTVPTLAVFD